MKVKIHKGVLNMNKRIEKMFSIENIDTMRVYVLQNMRHVSRKEINNTMILCRFQHMERVSMISLQLLQLYLSEYERCGKKYRKGKTCLKKEDFPQLANIKKHGLENAVVFMGIIHDMYKFDEYNTEHGIRASQFFEQYCEKNHIPMKGMIKDIHDAIHDHSLKNKNQENIFFKILCDADILSKYSKENVIEKKYKDGKSPRDTVKLIDADKYDYKTPFFRYLRKMKRKKFLKELKRIK